MSANTASHAGLESRVGNNVPRLRGDFVIWDPDREFTVSVALSYVKLVRITFTFYDLAITDFSKEYEMARDYV